MQKLWLSCLETFHASVKGIQVVNLILTLLHLKEDGRRERIRSPLEKMDIKIPILS